MNFVNITNIMNNVSVGIVSLMLLFIGLMQFNNYQYDFALVYFLGITLFFGIISFIVLGIIPNVLTDFTYLTVSFRFNVALFIIFLITSTTAFFINENGYKWKHQILMFILIALYSSTYIMNIIHQYNYTKKK